MARRRIRFAAYGASLLLVIGIAATTSYLLVDRIGDAGLNGHTAVGSGKFSYSPDFTLEDAQQFEDFSVYWLGESFQGLPVRRLWTNQTTLPRYQGITTKTIVGFAYGDCTIPPGADACGMPIGIQVRPYCQVPPEIIAQSVKTGDPVTIRGAVAQWTGGDLVLWTNDVSISIAGQSQELVNAAAHNLISLTPGGPATPDEPLGPPQAFTCPAQPNFLP